MDFLEKIIATDLLAEVLVLLVVETGGAAGAVLGELGGGSPDAIAGPHTPRRRPSVRRLVHRPLEHRALKHTTPTLLLPGVQ